MLGPIAGTTCHIQLPVTSRLQYGWLASGARTFRNASKPTVMMMCGAWKLTYIIHVNVTLTPRTELGLHGKSRALQLQWAHHILLFYIHVASRCRQGGLWAIL